MQDVIFAYEPLEKKRASLAQNAVAPKQQYATASGFYNSKIASKNTALQHSATKQDTSLLNDDEESGDMILDT